MAPDPKPARRVKDPGLMRLMHLTPGPCALADATCEPTLNLHHILARKPHGGDDVRANLMWLCGSGVTGHHGLITRNDDAARCALQAHLLSDRPDFHDYLARKLRSEVRAEAWMEGLCR